MNEIQRTKLEPTDVIRRFSDFFEKNYESELTEKVRKGESFLNLDFSLLASFDPELSEELLDEPEESIKAAEIALERYEVNKNFRVRVKNLPESMQIMVKDVRSEHINKFLFTKGLVRQKSDVRPQVTSARFECPACGNVITVLQLDQKFKEPNSCGCGRKGKFRLLSKELVDAQKIVLEEAPEDLEGGEQPKRIDLFLKSDLVSPLSDKKTNPGTKIKVTGVLKEVPIPAKDGGKLTRYDLMIEVNHVEPIQEDFLELNISKEEEEEIKKLAADPDIYNKLVRSLAPTIYGHDKIKEALILQSFGGVRKKKKKGSPTRGDMHILLIGDPGAGKCLSEDTKIVIEDGNICSIKSIVEKNNSYVEYPMKVFSISEKGLNFSSQPVRFWKRKAPKKMLKVTTNTGSEIKVTKEHPLFTTKNGFIFAKKAEEYKISEYIALPSKIEVKGELQVVNTKVIKSKSKNKVRYKIPTIFDKNFARFLGYLVGDGYIRQRKTTGIISFTNKNIDLLNDFEQLSKEIFNLRVSKRKKQGTEVYEYYFSSIEIVQILENIDSNITKKSKDMEISETVLKSPDYVVKEFLKSLFDCEAHIRKGRREIEFSSKSKNLIENLKLVLLRFGIISQLSSGIKFASNTINKTKRIYYRLRISGENAIRFHDEIGFVSEYKRHELNKLISYDKTLNTNTNIVPNIKGLLISLRRKYGLSQYSFNIKRSTYQHYEKGDRFPSYDKLRIVCQAYNKYYEQDAQINVLNQIANAKIFWDKIKSIEEIETNDEFVYDLEIENVHNYVANGIVVHNSQLLKRVSEVAPKARYVSGKGASGAGLTATVVKDEFIRGYALEAGALVLANRGICCIDELDKMSKEDRSAMHEALEQQTVTISKANIQATLRSETTVLAAANPKFGRFDPFEILAKQIDLPSTLINRFDLIFPIKDMPNEQNDEKLASFILHMHKDKAEIETEIDNDMLRKYFAYARQKIKPVLTDEAIEEIKSYYIQMRGSGSEEGGIKAIPITARQLEALVRLSEASAKVRLSAIVTREDAKRAVELVHHCLSQIGMDPETGKFDIDRISSGVTANERGSIVLIKEMINELEIKVGKTIGMEDLLIEASSKGIKEDKVMEIIEKLKRSGDIYEPKKGFISKI